MATRDAGYTKTGNSWLASVANKMSFVPFLNLLSAPVLALDTGLSAIGWVFRGKFASAGATVLSGGAATATAALASHPFFWPANLLSLGTTGRSVQTHARAMTETATSFVSKPLGMQPTVLRSHYAGIGGVSAPAQPGQFATMEAQRRGQDPQQMYNNYMRGDGGVAVAQMGGQASRA